jgi:hypothetical protein
VAAGPPRLEPPHRFEVQDTHPDRQPSQAIRCTDPTAPAVDRRQLAPRLPPPYPADDQTYELPTAWTRGQDQIERGVGTFRDVRAPVDTDVGGRVLALAWPPLPG